MFSPCVCESRVQAGVARWGSRAGEQGRRSRVQQITGTPCLTTGLYIVKVCSFIDFLTCV